jgi:hypothetical protein
LFLALPRTARDSDNGYVSVKRTNNAPAVDEHRNAQAARTLAKVMPSQVLGLIRPMFGDGVQDETYLRNKADDDDDVVVFAVVVVIVVVVVCRQWGCCTRLSVMSAIFFICF